MPDGSVLFSAFHCRWLKAFHDSLNYRWCLRQMTIEHLRPSDLLWWFARRSGGSCTSISGEAPAAWWAECWRCSRQDTSAGIVEPQCSCCRWFEGTGRVSSQSKAQWTARTQCRKLSVGSHTSRTLLLPGECQRSHEQAAPTTQPGASCTSNWERSALMWERGVWTFAKSPCACCRWTVRRWATSRKPSRPCSTTRYHCGSTKIDKIVRNAFNEWGILGVHLVRIIVPALLDVPQPWLVPHDNHTEDKAVCVVNASPAILTELNERRGLVLSLASTPPSLDLSLRQVQLLCKI